VAKLTSITEHCSGCGATQRVLPEPDPPLVPFVSIRRNIVLTFCVPCSTDEPQVTRTFALWALKLMR